MGPDERDREMLRRIQKVRLHQADKSPAAAAREILRGWPQMQTLQRHGQSEEDYRAELTAFAAILDGLEGDLVRRVEAALRAEGPGPWA